MDDLAESYKGKPFVGIQTTAREGAADEAPLRTYCLLVPSTETEPEGLHGIPMDFDPRDLWGRGVHGLAAIVVSKYGPQYCKRVTFEAPRPQIISSTEARRLVTKYESLPADELRFFHVVAELYSRR